MLSFSRVSNLPDDLPDWIRAEASVKRHAAAARPPCCSRRRASPSTTPTCPKKRNRREKEGRSCSDSRFYINKYSATFSVYLA